MVNADRGLPATPRAVGLWQEVGPGRAHDPAASSRPSWQHYYRSRNL